APTEAPTKAPTKAPTEAPTEAPIKVKAEHIDVNDSNKDTNRKSTMLMMIK
ncbi:5484_t:CDS:1, partial [Cetraspora pellucida]